MHVSGIKKRVLPVSNYEGELRGSNLYTLGCRVRLLVQVELQIRHSAAAAAAPTPLNRYVTVDFKEFIKIHV